MRFVLIPGFAQEHIAFPDRVGQRQYAPPIQPVEHDKAGIGRDESALAQHRDHRTERKQPKFADLAILVARDHIARQLQVMDKNHFRLQTFGHFAPNAQMPPRARRGDLLRR